MKSEQEMTRLKVNSCENAYYVMSVPLMVKMAGSTSFASSITTSSFTSGTLFTTGAGRGSCRHRHRSRRRGWFPASAGACRTPGASGPEDITLGEYKLVHLLVSNAGSFVTYRSLYDRLHFQGFIAGSGTDAFRVNIRSAIKAAGDTPTEHDRQDGNDLIGEPSSALFVDAFLEGENIALASARVHAASLAVSGPSCRSYGALR
jgi:hypothetical protein